jgi:outer membrane protein assembly factor BamB
VRGSEQIDTAWGIRMKYFAPALAAAIIAASVSAQDPAKLYSQPAVPDQDALQRLNLKLEWRAFIPMDGRRDSVFSMQSAGDLILVQTRSGLICAIEPETGRFRWQKRVGQAYRVYVRLGFNSRSVYAVNDQSIYVLDRETGDIKWHSELPSALTAAPVADELQIFLSERGGALTAYSLPTKNPNVVSKPASPQNKDVERTAYKDVERTAAPVAGGGMVRVSASIGAMNSATGRTSGTLVSIGTKASSLEAARLTTADTFQPTRDWSDNSELRVEVPPLQTPDVIFLVGAGGRIAAFSKGPEGGVRYNKPVADDLVLVPPGQYQDEAYIASRDTSLYAVVIPTGAVKWRFTAGSAITRRPAATDRDVYVSVEQGGLRRLNRADGMQIWQNREADRFVAMNSKIVYATDSAGRLLLLDHARGTQIGMLNTRDFPVPIINDYTDRVYLGSNDGMLICLHDRDLPKPHINKQIEVDKPAVKRRAERQREKPADKPMPKPKAPEKDPAEEKGDAMEKKP